jgi:hypothetical protein
MSFKKAVAIAAAAGALAAISVPAMALENEFHGSYSFNTTFSNFQAGGSGDFNPAGKAEHLKMNNYFEQRARLQYTAKVSDDLKMVTQFEFDNRFGAGRTAGSATPTNTNPPAQGFATGNGGDLDTDFTNFELKHLYLDFNLGKSFNTKLGLMPYRDTIKGLFIDADLPAIMTTTKLGAYTLGIGFSRFDDDFGTNNQGSTTTTNFDAVTRLGDKNKDLFILDNTFAITKDTKVALSYYFLADYANGSTGGVPTAQGPLALSNADSAILLNTLGLSAETKIGPLSLSGFAAAQAGHQKAAGTQVRRNFHGYAGNVAAKLAAGPGTLKLGALFTSGDNSTNSGSYKGWVTSSVNSYNEGGMMILARNTGNSPSSTDTFIRRNVTNLALLTAGYDANLTDKLFLNGNVGLGWAPSSVGAPNANAGDFLGAEANLEVGYKVYANLTLKAQAAYMMLGSYYKDSSLTAGKDPEAPYSGRLHAQFKF